MDADVLALFCRKTLKNSIIELYKVRQKITGGPGIAQFQPVAGWIEDDLATWFYRCLETQ